MLKQQVDAIYENGVLKPLTPVDLAEHQRVVIMIGVEDGDEDDRDSEEYLPLAADDGDPSITWEQVHAALAGSKGSLSDEIIHQRDERF
jgi:predicted DNA-binding antitoxin AbrB/MazE fold protein